MRRSLAAFLVLVASPAWAGGGACRLSTTDCTIIAREMANEEIARITDERNFHPYGLTPYEGGRELIKHHYQRKIDRILYLSRRVSNEMARMELCNAQESAATSMTSDEVSEVLNGTKPNPIDQRCR